MIRQDAVETPKEGIAIKMNATAAVLNLFERLEIFIGGLRLGPSLEAE
jgi:hypothetical protein